MAKPFGINYAVKSEIGLVRDTNQDSAYASDNLLVVADGMGGHAGGDVASTIAINVIESLDQQEHTPHTAVADLEIALEQARLALVRASEIVPRLQGLGTTVVCLLSAGPTLYMAHMGDSRAYLLRAGELMQTTVDHTFVQHLIDLGRITPAEAEHHPQRNVVMRVLSDFDLNLSPEISVREARIGDRWLLCSDGLSGFVSPDEILSILTNYAAPEKAAEALVAAALANLSNDNVTCLVADIVAPEAVRPQTAKKVGAAAVSGPYPQLVQTVVAEAARRVGRTDDIDNWDTEEIWLGTQPIDTNAVVAAISGEQPQASSALSQDTEVLPGPITQATITQVVATAPPEGLAGQSAAPFPVFDDLINPTAAPQPGNVAAVASGLVGTIPPASVGPVPPPPTAFLEDKAAAFAEDDDPAALPAAKSRPWLAVGVTLAVLGLLSIGLWRAYVWTQTQYFVGISDGQVAVFRGIPDSVGPVQLSHPVQLFDAPVQDLPELFLGRLDGTIRAESFDEAIQHAQRLIAEATAATPQPLPGVVPPTVPVVPPIVAPTTSPTTTPTTSPAPQSPAPTTPPANTGGG